MKTIRDENNNVAYKLYENKLYNTTTVRDSHGNVVAKFSNDSHKQMTTSEKLSNNCKK